jgi:hypothetical protein
VLRGMAGNTKNEVKKYKAQEKALDKKLAVLAKSKRQQDARVARAKGRAAKAKQRAAKVEKVVTPRPFVIRPSTRLQPVRRRPSGTGKRRSPRGRRRPRRAPTRSAGPRRPRPRRPSASVRSALPTRPRRSWRARRRSTRAPRRRRLKSRRRSATLPRRRPRARRPQTRSRRRRASGPRGAAARPLPPVSPRLRHVAYLRVSFGGVFFCCYRVNGVRCGSDALARDDSSKFELAVCKTLGIHQGCRS